jgi:hypothetical protein
LPAVFRGRDTNPRSRSFSDGRRTLDGVAFCNPASVPVNLTLGLSDADGIRLKAVQQTPVLPALGQLAPGLRGSVGRSKSAMPQIGAAAPLRLAPGAWLGCP